jgi:hypothetical protein
MYLKVTISRYVDNAFPGFVECTMVDAKGEEHVFVDKVPVLTTANLNETSDYPRLGSIACIVIGRKKLNDGRELVQIDTSKPWGVESNVGRTKFEIFSEQLSELSIE